MKLCALILSLEILLMFVPPFHHSHKARMHPFMLLLSQSLKAYSFIRAFFLSHYAGLFIRAGILVRDCS